jgi:hypothetical protein
MLQKCFRLLRFAIVLKGRHDILQEPTLTAFA